MCEYEKQYTKWKKIKQNTSNSHSFRMQQKCIAALARRIKQKSSATPVRCRWRTASTNEQTNNWSQTSMHFRFLQTSTEYKISIKTTLLNEFSLDSHTRPNRDDDFYVMHFLNANHSDNDDNILLDGAICGHGNTTVFGRIVNEWFQFISRKDCDRNNRVEIQLSLENDEISWNYNLFCVLLDSRPTTQNRNHLHA